MSPTSIPSAVLSQALAERIAGRRVRIAVFTTFSFDPGFFELHVLPLLFDQSFSQVDKVRRIQLEDALREVDELAVYYDRSALSQDAEPARLDYRRIDVSRATGCFHPKLALLLLEEPQREDPEESPTQSLLVCIQSANLTRAGWWENLECAHIEEIPSAEVAQEKLSIRSDLMSLLLQVQRSGPPEDDHSALERIRGFLRHETPRREFARHRSQGRYHTRLFCGQDRQSLSEWLAGLRLARGEWNLEIVSPYFDAHGAAPLADLVETLQPRETRVFLPRELDGRAAVTEASYRAVAEWAHWAEVPSSLVARGRDRTSERLPPRRVHAKLYRLWRRGSHDLLIVGSVNLTSPAHGSWASGNLEAAFLVDATDELAQRWWLSRIDEPPSRFSETTLHESEGGEEAPVALSLRYDWARRRLDYRLLTDDPSPLALRDPAGTPLASIEEPVLGQWTPLPPAVGERMADLLQSSSFVRVEHRGGSWRVLVREESMGHRPSLLMELTPEEILQYWSLLTAEQRAVFLEERLGVDAELEGLTVTRREALRSHGTMFDRFAGVYHAFGCLRKYVEEAMAQGRSREAEARLLGVKYDSLPCLLRKTLESDRADPVLRYVTFLCARQTRDAVARSHGSLFEREEACRPLDELLGQLPALRRQVADAGIEDAERFLEWYEPAFLGEIRSS